MHAHDPCDETFAVPCDGGSALAACIRNLLARTLEALPPPLPPPPLPPLPPLLLPRVAFPGILLPALLLLLLLSVPRLASAGAAVAGLDAGLVRLPNPRHAIVIAQLSS